MPPKAKLLVFSSGDLAIPVLDAVTESGHEILRIVAQPLRDASDGFVPEERQESALGNWARGRKLDLKRVSHPSDDKLRESLAALEPDLGLIVAYGRSFPTALLEVPKRGWIKVHFSLLPKYRGLHAIRAALWHGDRQTGATVIQVTDEPDAGPILSREVLDIEKDETFGELAPRVAALGADLVAPAIARVVRAKSPKVRKQNEKKATVAPRFGRRHRFAPWWREAKVVHNHLRALSPEPGMTMLVKGGLVRILQGAPANYIERPIGETGSFIGLRSGRMAILCGNGTVYAVDQVQPSRGEPMSARSLARERKLKVGDVVV